MATDTKKLCYHCSLTMIADDCGEGTILAYWRNHDGRAEGGDVLVCRDCLDAGDPDGPGYVAWPG